VRLAVFQLQLPDALMLWCERLAYAALALLLRVELTESAPDDTFAKPHDFAVLTNAQALDFDHLSYLEFDACVKGSSGLLVVHVYRHLKKPIVVSL
jgi:hypothetical protein